MSAEREVIVSNHAIRQYQSRRGDSRTVIELEREIRERINDAIRNGCVRNHKPNGFYLYGQRRANLPADQRFVGCEDDVGWIIKIEGERNIVLTTLTRAGVHR